MPDPDPQSAAVRPTFGKATSDHYRRVAAWSAVAPQAIAAAGMAGVFASSAGLPVMLAVMAGTLLTVLIAGRLLWARLQTDGEDLPVQGMASNSTS